MTEEEVSSLRHNMLYHLRQGMAEFPDPLIEEEDFTQTFDEVSKAVVDNDSRVVAFILTGFLKALKGK